MDDLYEVVDFEERYMTPESRRYKHLPWIPIPTSHDGLAFRKIAALKNDTEVFTAWVLILQISANLKDRGVLKKDGLPLNAKDLAELSGYPMRIFTEAFRVLTEPKINWLRRSPSSHPAVTQQSPSSHPAVTQQSPSSHPLLHEHEHKHEDEDKEGEATAHACAPVRNVNGGKPPADLAVASLTEATSILLGWNKFAKEVGINQIHFLSEKRKVGLKRRAKTKDFNLPAILKKIRQSDFLRGQNDRGWRVDFDFIFCSDSNWLKIMEGKYDNREITPPKSARELREERAIQESMAMADEADRRDRELAKKGDVGND